MKNIKDILINEFSNIALNNHNFEVDIEETSISIQYNQGEYLIIFKESINQIWYSSPISGASRFKIIDDKCKDFNQNFEQSQLIAESNLNLNKIENKSNKIEIKTNANIEIETNVNVSKILNKKISVSKIINNNMQTIVLNHSNLKLEELLLIELDIDLQKIMLTKN